jgi:hypothetical protein
VSYVQLGSTLENSQGFNILTLDIFKLYRNFWDFAFENPEKIKPNHIAIFSFAIEHCNRLGWKKKFGLPSTMTMEAVGIKSYNTYISAFNDLVEFGFIDLIEKSKNQYSSNIIALSDFNKANDKALNKALIKHTTKQSESTLQSTGESISSIDIQETNIQETKKQRFEEFWNLYDKKVERKSCYNKFMKLDLKVIEKIINVVPFYVKSTPEVKYRKNPETWINGECWNDEIKETEKKEEGYTLANGSKISTNFAF